MQNDADQPNEMVQPIQNKSLSLLMAVLITVVLAITIAFLSFSNKSDNFDNVQDTVAPSTSVQTSTYEPTTATPTNDTEQWKKYSSKEFGFSFEYPKDWEAEERLSDIQKNTTANKEFLSFLAIGPDPSNDDSLIEIRVQTSTFDQVRKDTIFAMLVDSRKESAITINGVVGTKFAGEAQLAGVEDSHKQMAAVILPYNDKIYIIRYYQPLDTALEDETFNHLLDSWEFVKE